MHHHPSGGDRLAEAESSVLGAGTAVPCPMAPPPLGRCPPELGRAQQEPGWSPEVAVHTAMVRAVHRHGAVRCHRLFLTESEGAGLVTATVTAMVTAMHHPIFLERRVFGVLAEVAPPPPVRCHRRLSGDHG